MIKKLYITALSMILLTLTFTTATFAWVSMGDTNRVDGLSLNASTDSNLEFSLDGVNYNSSITNDQLQILFKDLRMEDVTSIDGNEFFSNYSMTEKYAYPNINYISLEIYVRTNTRYRDVYLVNNVTSTTEFDNTPQNGTFVTSKGIEYRSPVDFEFAPGIFRNSDVPYKYYAKDAIRMSFTELKLDNPNDNRNDDEMINFIFDPSDNPDRGYGKPYGAISFVNNTKVFIVPVPTNVPETLYELSSFDEYNPYIPLNPNSKIMRLIKTDNLDNQNRFYYEGKFRINIWLEGFDADMFDAIYRDTLKFQLEFRSALPVD